MDGIELNDHGLAAFDRLIREEPLTFDEMMAMPRFERTQYLVCQLKLWPGLVVNNVLQAGIEAALNRVCPDLTGHQRLILIDQLTDPVNGLMKSRASDAELVTLKSDNVTQALIAVLIYNEGGWIRCGSVVRSKPNPR